MSMAGELRRTIDDLRTENSGLRTSLDELNDELYELRARHDALRTENEQWRTANVTFNASCNELRAELVRRDVVKGAQWSKEQFGAMIRALRTENEALRTENDRVCAVLDANVAEYNELQCGALKRGD